MSTSIAHAQIARLSGPVLVVCLSLGVGLSGCSKSDAGPLGGSSFTSTDTAAGSEDSTTAGDTGDEDSSSTTTDSNDGTTTSSDDTTTSNDDTTGSSDDTTGATDTTDTGDGDGDTSTTTNGGDGDSGMASTTGDGDGDTSTSGDGDGDTSTTGGDGDGGTTTGSGDGYPYGGAFWYLADDFGDTCNATCTSHGGFAPSALDYSGDVVSVMMNPELQLGGSDFEAMECLATNDLRWGRNAATSPTGEESNGICRYYCPCNQ
jgi:hypothetical protein